MNQASLKNTSVFISYSHKDVELRDELIEHLALLQRQGLVNVWYDRKIDAGEEFDRVIWDNLNSADIILLLISPAFLASNYCYEREMIRAISRHELGEARTIPVILRPCDWNSAPIGKLVSLPTDGKPVHG